MSRFNRLIVIMAASCAMFLVHFTFVAAAEMAGRVSEVTLYRSQALITRTIPLKGAAGSMELTIQDLPQNVVGDSLFAEGSKGVEVRAVRFRTRAVGQEPREEVRKLDAAIEALNLQIQQLNTTQELLTKRAQYLDKLDTFVATTGKTDLAKGVLDANALEQITTFSFEKRQEGMTEQLDIAVKLRKATEQLTLEQRRRAELTNSSSRTVREALIFLEKKDPADQNIRLNYLVNQCGWSPSYTVRATSNDDPVRVEYNALIQQMSGEDWQNVKLSLSTASPSLSAAGPGLAPFHVTLNQQGQQKPGQNLNKRFEDIRVRQKSAISQNRITYGLRDNIDSSWLANSAANDFQCLELINPKDALRSLPPTGGPSEGPSLSYELAGNVSLASRADQQMVRILQTELKGQSYHVATPVLSSYVFREAELENDSDHDLLGGPITVYLDGRFVGRSEIPTVARGQNFVIGFGADPQLRTVRELADRTEDAQGGNKELTFDYRLVVENYKDADAKVRVLDRLPYSNRQADIRVTLGEMSDKLSTDKLYVRTERPKGILLWEIDVPAGATGDEARIIEYAYNVSFDRNFEITSVGDSSKRLQEEFESLQIERQTR